jgi:hypothetical protein
MMQSNACVLITAVPITNCSRGIVKIFYKIAQDMRHTCNDRLGNRKTQLAEMLCRVRIHIH